GLVYAHEHLFATRAGCIDVDSREDTLVGELPRQAQFHVARALELFEDHFVHLRTGLDECGGDDGERAALFDVARRTEESLRRVQRRRVDTTGEDATGCGGRKVVRAAEAGDRVE